MKVVQQKSKLNICNLDPYTMTRSNKKKKLRHGKLLPATIRCIIVGPSNSGKTNLMLNLLFDANALKFDNIYVFSKSIYQPKYKFLARVMKGVPEVGYFEFTDNDSLSHPNDIEPNSVMIFDDVACEKQDHIRNYFSMGRHNNIDTFYLAQTYSRIPKQLVRDNANFLVLFKQDDLNLRHIYNDHVNTDMTYDKFREICRSAWSTDKNGFLVLDKDSDAENGRYRLGFDRFVTKV